MSESNASFLSGIHALLLEQGIGKARKRILSRQLEEKGGVTTDKISEDGVTHIIVGSTVKLSRLTHLLKVDSLPKLPVVRADWLSSCLVAGKRLDTAPYLVQADLPSPVKTARVQASLSPRKSPKLGEDSACLPALSEVTSVAKDVLPASDEEGVSSSEKTTPTKRWLSPGSAHTWKVSPGKRSTHELDSDSDYVEEDDEEEMGQEGSTLADMEKLTEEGLVRPVPKKAKWACEVPVSQMMSKVNYNQHITDKLEELLSTYKTSSLPKDRWRAMSLTKAITAIKKHPKEITTYEEARDLPFIGERLADKVYEIISSGRLRRLDHVDQDKLRTINLFMGVHGIGQTTAEQFYAKGYRTLEDLHELGRLNRQQQIGLKYYDEFKERMERSEVEQIEMKVKEACSAIDPALEVVTCGSYRRGRPTCGDVDILVTHPDGRSHKGVFAILLQSLRDSGYLTDDLSIHDDPVGGQCKYLGVFLLPGDGRKHRRIDIYTCPYSEYPLMLLHFTGSGHFNRSMRHKADKMGMSLSEHSLNAGVIRRNGVKIFDGTPLPVFSEEDVFRYLQIPYQEPNERDLA